METVATVRLCQWCLEQGVKTQKQQNMTKSKQFSPPRRIHHSPAQGPTCPEKVQIWFPGAEAVLVSTLLVHQRRLTGQTPGWRGGGRAGQPGRPCQAPRPHPDSSRPCLDPGPCPPSSSDCPHLQIQWSDSVENSKSHQGIEYSSPVDRSELAEK